jgi:hypothetical protein
MKPIKYQLWELAALDNSGPLEPFILSAESSCYMDVLEKFNKMIVKMPCAIFIRTDNER